METSVKSLRLPGFGARALFGKVEGFYNSEVTPRERSRLWPLRDIAVSFEMAVISFAVGIAVYFAWPVEPDWRIAAIVSGLGVALSVRRNLGWGWLGSLVSVGFAVAALHTVLVNPNPLEREQRLTISGTVTKVERGRPMRRVTIAVSEAAPMPRTGPPKTLRVRVGKAWPDVAIGQPMTLDAVVSPLPGPAVPHGYDPARRAFFGGLAGSGFAISPPRAFDAELGFAMRWRVWLSAKRRSIADRVIASAPPETSGLQAALLTGLRDDISEAQSEALRASGLAHILAISGLHMGMVSFGVFAALSAALALLPQAAGRDMRKVAALVSIVAATAYLGLSGASVATQRAYIMVVIAFLAVLLDRRAISLRSVAVAAAVTLAFHPEALMSVGIQMSFAAVTALVVVYREWADRRPRIRAQGLRSRVVSYYGSLTVTSLVAGVATGAFAMFHFGRIARYGLLGNVAAMVFFPLVMASGMVALIAMPLGLEQWPLQAMGWLLGIMLVIADWVAGLPGAVDTVKATHPVALALYGAGFVGLCLASRQTVIPGAAMVIGAAIIWVMSPSASLRVTVDGRVSVFADGAAYTSNLRADRYGRDQFARGAGEGAVVWQSYRETLAQCDALGCRFQVDGHWVSVVEEASEVPLACSDSAVVVLPERDAGIVGRRRCEAILLDRRALRELGGAHIETAPTVQVRAVKSERRAKRPWGAGG